MSVIIPSERLELENPVHQFPYRLDDFQSNGCYAIQNNNNVLITAHTAAGKTTIAEYAIALSNHLGKKVLYTSPIKTLSNQKYFDFQKTFGNVGILTGDIKLNPEADIIVLTTEILRNKLDHELEQFEEIHCVIFDEVHYFNDPERGFVWEECITKLPKHIIIVMLSATIDKAQEFANWVANCRERNCYLIGTTWRPVPLNHYIYTKSNLLMINKHRDGIQQRNIDSAYQFYSKEKMGKKHMCGLMEYLEKRNLFPAICFSFSRKKCQEYALMLKQNAGYLSQEELKQTKLIIHKVFSTNLHFYKEIASTVQLLEFLEYGIAFHHSGLLPVQKELVEILFSRGLIKILFATETFAVGVNMPTKTVIFTELSKYDGRTQSPRTLRYDEFMQMSGRAGRRGKDDEGLVIYCPVKFLEDKHDIVGLLRGKSAKLTSQYNESTNTFLRLINVNTDIKKFYNHTLFGSESKKHILHLISEEQKLKEEIDKMELSSNFMSKEDKDIISEYEQLEVDVQSAKGKNRVRMIKKMEQMKKSFSTNVKTYFEKIAGKYKLSQNANFLKDCIEEQSNTIDNNIQNISNFNKELGLIIDDGASFGITSYGKIVASLSNCSEIVLAKVIQLKLLEKCDWKTIGILFACFAPEKQRDVSEDEIWEKIKYNLQPDEIDLIDNTWDYYWQVIEQYEKYNMEHRLNMSFTFIEPFMMWIEKKPLNEILAIYDNFDGNFVKNIYKIRDICQEVLKVCEIFNMGELEEKINILMENLIYGIGEFNSLYIHHYDMISSL